MNETHKHNEYSLSIFFIISLLLHFSIMFYWVHYKNQHHSLIAKEQKNEWTPVYFRNDYQTETTLTNYPHTITNPTNSNSINSKSIEENTIELEPVVETVSQPLEQHIDTDITTIQTQKVEPQEAQPKSLQHSNPSTQLRQGFLRQAQDERGTAGRHVRRSFSEVGAEKKYKSTNLTRTVQRQQQKQLPSLAQLTQGIMNYLQQNNKHLKKNEISADEQLKHERYLERLYQCVYNSFKINSHEQPTLFSYMSTIIVHLELNKNGSIHNLKLVQSSGNGRMDFFVMNMIRDASSSFPPVPHYLPHNPFSTYCFIDPLSHYK